MEHSVPFLKEKAIGLSRRYIECNIIKDDLYEITSVLIF